MKTKSKDPLTGAAISRGAFLAIVCHSMAAGAVQAQGVEERPEDVVAAQIRRQGYVCTKAVSAVRDATLSKPDEAVWILKCDDGSYLVRLIPEQAAKVERVQ